MTSTTSSTALATTQPAFTNTERLALAGVPGRILRPDARGLHPGPAPGHRLLPLFAVRRADIETFARGPEARGRARATVDLVSQHAGKRLSSRHVQYGITRQ
jgi:hypothetical protein